MKKKTHEQFMNELKHINDSVTINSEYAGTQTSISCTCVICGYTWDTLPNTLLLGSSCPQCSKLRMQAKLRKEQELFIEQMRENNPTISVVGNYINNKTHIEVKCKICGCEWKAMPCHLIRGHGCPECANRKRVEALRLARQAKIRGR